MLLPAARLLFAAAEQHEAAEIDVLREPREGGGGHDAGLDLGLVAFAVRRKPVEQQVGDDEPEHRVAQELERLVVDDAARRVFVRARSVRQRVLEQAEVARTCSRCVSSSGPRCSLSRRISAAAASSRWPAISSRARAGRRRWTR